MEFISNNNTRQTRLPYAITSYLSVKLSVMDKCVNKQTYFVMFFYIADTVFNIIFFANSDFFSFVSISQFPKFEAEKK